MTTGVTVLTRPTTIALPSLRELELEGWMAWQSVPDSLDIQTLDAAIALHEAALQPAPACEFAQLMDALLKFARCFGLTDAGRDDIVTIMRIYHQSLSDVPADLLVKAVEQIRSRWKWSGRMPLPADLREMISDELSTRTFLLAKLRTVKSKMQRERGERSSGSVLKLVNASKGPLAAKSSTGS